MSRLLFNSAQTATTTWDLLPLRFHRLAGDRVVVTNMVGEHLVLPRSELDAVLAGEGADAQTLAAMRARHLLREPGETLPLELLAVKLRTRTRRLAEMTALHMFVVTLRCEHTCRYCQVSRQSTAHGEFDMTRETAEAALAQVFRSPSSQLKIEFQGGESLLNFDLIRWIVGQAEEHNRTEGRDLAFAIATNLALIDEDVLDFCGEHGVVLSTSLDGPEDLHNRNRRRPGQDSWQRTIEGIRLIQDRLGPDYVSALMTTTEDSLDRPEEIIDAYVDLTSPAGIGIGGIVYNYDGGVYASDEGRMLAEMGDETFRLGHVEDAWSDLLGSSKLLTPLWESMTVSAPACDTCAFEQWCGADPTYHHATASDFVGHKTLSGFCARNMGVFTHLVELVDADPFVRDLLWQWGHR